MSPLCVSLTYLFLPHPLLFVAVVVAIATDLEVGEERCCVNAGEQVGGTLGQGGPLPPRSREEVLFKAQRMQRFHHTRPPASRRTPTGFLAGFRTVLWFTSSRSVCLLRVAVTDGRVGRGDVLLSVWRRHVRDHHFRLPVGALVCQLNVREPAGAAAGCWGFNLSPSCPGRDAPTSVHVPVP